MAAAVQHQRRGEAAHEPRAGSPTPSQLPPVPGSPVYSIASTTRAPSQFNLPLPPAPRPAHAVLRKADLEHSHEAYADLVASAKAYRLALASLSSAASAFGSALEACARLKEARAEPIGPAGGGMTASFAASRAACTADPLMSASGVHHLIANHQQILSETVYRSFEVPLLHDLDKWRSVIDDEEETYQHKIMAQSREVKRLEKEGLKLHKQRRRDVARFRAHLVELTNKLDGLTTLHADHARTLLRESQETSGRIVDASCSLVRAEVDIFEGLARKGWTGGGLDDLLDRGQDLFASDEAGAATALHHHAADSAKLFSILPPKSILADSASGPDRGDGLLPADADRYPPPLAAAAAASSSGGSSSSSARSHASSSSTSTITAAATAASAPSSAKPAPGDDADSVFSADFNRPRNARPFSPQPIRRIPTDVTFDSLGALAAGPGPPTRPPAEQASASTAREQPQPQEQHSSPSSPPREEEEEKEEEEEAGGQGAAEEAPGERGRQRSQSPWATRSTSLPDADGARN